MGGEGNEKGREGKGRGRKGEVLGNYFNPMGKKEENFALICTVLCPPLPLLSLPSTLLPSPPLHI